MKFGRVPTTETIRRGSLIAWENMRLETIQPPRLAEATVAPLVSELRGRVTAYYGALGEPIDTPAAVETIDTNSTFVERRARPLLSLLASGADLRPQAGLKVLDLGAGFGALGLYLAAYGMEVTGIDPRYDRLQVGAAVAAARGLPFQIREGRMEELPFDAQSFDVVIANNSLCYVVDREGRRAALAEALRVLRPSGAILVRNPNRWHPRDQFTGRPLIHLLAPRTAARTAKALGLVRSDVRLMSPPAAIGELRRAGFTAVRYLAAPDSRRRGATKLVARYQHLLARKPQA
jgi:ubiquinone/menaquinone biosynthesis C-methylase UbiE